MVEILSKNKKAWVNVMMAEELGLNCNEKSPTKNALVTFFSFVLFGVIPLLPFIVAKVAGKDDRGFIIKSPDVRSNIINNSFYSRPDNFSIRLVFFRNFKNTIFD